MNELPTTACITPTKGRHKHIERVLTCFLEQDYIGKSILLIYNNSNIQQTLGKFEIPENKQVILINNHVDRASQEPYTNLGAIYRDILSYIPEEVSIITHMDDDDIYLPSHISSGVFNLIKSDKLAYKPKFSWFLTSEGVKPIENVLEPSIFIYRDHLIKHGYYENTINQHHKWLESLKPDKLLVDPKGKKTFIYTWDGGVFKTSGDPLNEINFQRYDNFSQDHGDQIITPFDRSEVTKYYYLC